MMYDLVYYGLGGNNLKCLKKAITIPWRMKIYESAV